MTRREFLITGTLALSLAPSAMGQGKISVGLNVQVSKGNADRAHFETWIAADPSNPNRLLGGSMVASSEPSRWTMFDVVIYASFDGGKTWEPTHEQHAPFGSFDPACTYGPDGTAYFVAVSVDSVANGRNDGRVFLYRSVDGGKAWKTPISLPYVDRPYVVVDTKGKYAGQIYFNGTAVGAPSGMQLGVSKDGGLTFQWTKVTDDEKRYSRNNGNGVVLSDGTYAAVYSTEDQAPKPSYSSKPPNGQIWCITSNDGGQSLSKSVLVSPWHSPLLGSLPLAHFLPMLAVDHSQGPFRDRLYTVWSDVQLDRSQILLSFSPDRGKTWSRPVTVNDDRMRPNRDLGPHDHSPIIAVNKEGVVGVAWMDRRDNPDNLGYYERFAASWDGGETFSPSVRVSEKPATFGQSADQLNATAIGGASGRGSGGIIEATLGYGGFTFIGGHTLAMAADADGVFHPFWVDNRTGVSQVWTARVTASGAAFKEGSSSLANLEDVTALVVLDLFHPVYDVGKKIVTVDAYLENNSSSVLKAPVVVRVLSLSSAIGQASIINPGNKNSAAGAVVDFSPTLEDSALKPGQRTRAKRLEIRLNEAQWPTGVSGANALVQLLKLRMKVLAVVPRR